MTEDQKRRTSHDDFFLSTSCGRWPISINCSRGKIYDSINFILRNSIFYVKPTCSIFPREVLQKKHTKWERAPKSNTVVVAKYFDVSCNLQFGMWDTCFQVISVASDILLDFWNPYILLKNKKDTMTQRLKCPKEEEILTKVT